MEGERQDIMPPGEPAQQGIGRRAAVATIGGEELDNHRALADGGRHRLITRGPGGEDGKAEGGEREEPAGHGASISRARARDRFTFR
jgi:hypothetical protein